MTFTGDEALAWLSQSDFDTATLTALWSMIGAAVATFVLFAYTMGLRVAVIIAKRRRRRLFARWHTIFARVMLVAADAEYLPLPSIRRSERTELIEEWNRTRSNVAGSAADNLTVLAKRIGIPVLVERLLHRRSVRSRILAVQTIGHLREQRHRDEIRELVNHENTALSIVAAVALVEIDAPYAIKILVPMIPKRRDWPKTRVSLFLCVAGSECISEPVCRAIRSSDNNDKTYLLQFGRLIESSALEALSESLLRESNDPGVLNAVLKCISGYNGIPRIAVLTRHRAWFVRMQAAKALGRVGSEEHLGLLESLLTDREWWVRYRAAQSIVQLPFLGPNRLRRIRDCQSDQYAVDIFQQVLAEAGLA